MVSTSPFKRMYHSRENSREDSSQMQSRINTHTRQQPPPNYPPHQRSPNPGHPSTSRTSVKSNTSAGSLNAAQQYDNDRARLIKYCFSTYDEDGILRDSYITHVRIIEDAAYPGTRPPEHSAPSNKKYRVLVLAVKKQGDVFLHKGRENENGSFQIGSSWSLNSLCSLTRDTKSDTGFMARLLKDYYWETMDTRARQIFITSLVRVYRKFKNGLVPHLYNWDLSMFGLDADSYKIFLNKEIKDRGSVNGIKDSNMRIPSKHSHGGASSHDQRSEGNANAALLALDTRSPSPSQGPQSPRSPIPRHGNQEAFDKLNSNARRFDSSERIPDRGHHGHRQPEPKSFDSKAFDNIKPHPSSNPELKSTQPEVSQVSPQQSSSRKGSISGSVSGSIKARVSPPLTDQPFSMKPSRQRGPSNLSYEVSNKPPASSPYRKLSTPLVEPVVASSNPEQDMLEQEINMKMSELGLDQIEIPERRDLARSDRPRRNMSMAREHNTSRSMAESLRMDQSSGNSSKRNSATKSIKSIEIVAHRKSLEQYQLEQEEKEAADKKADDITEFYQKAPPSPSAEHKDNDHSVQGLYDDSPKDDKKSGNVDNTPATEKGNQSDDEYDDLFDSPTELTTSLSFKKSSKRDRGNTINSTIDNTIHDDRAGSTFEDVFDMIDWDDDDDADSLAFKLMKELAKTQYDTIKQLVEVKEKSSALQNYSQSVVNECNKIGPLLSVFAVELSGLVDNVQRIESEGQGLQVETVNKKNLWKDLQTMLETVSVDDKSLKFLLNSEIDRNIESIELILSDLQSALNAIRGGEREQEDMGEMRALKERRRNYEAVVARFLKKMHGDLDQRFKHIFKSLLKNGDFKEDNIRKSLSKLLVYSSLTLFTKDISEESFDELIGTWEAAANTFLQDVLTHLNNSLVKLNKKNNKFSLASATAFKHNTDVMSTQKKADSKEDRLKARLGMFDEAPTTTKVTKPKEEPKEEKAVMTIFETLESLQKHVILQQDFLLKFFHVSTDELNVMKFIKAYPIKDRVALLDSSVSDIEPDLEHTREIYNSLAMIFQPKLDSLVKNLVQFLRSDQRNTPIVMLYLEVFENAYLSSNQDFLLVTYKKLSGRLKVDWLRFIDIEVKTIEKTTLASKKVREVSIFVKNFTRTIKDIEDNYSETLSEYGKPNTHFESRDLVNKAYQQIANAIIKNLKTQEEGSSRFNVNEDGEDRERKNCLINLIQNSNWLIERLSPLKLPILSSTITQSRDIFTSSKDQYIASIQNGNFAKIAAFVSDVEDLIKETSPKNVDPSKRNAYTTAVLTKVLTGVDTKEINKIVSGIREEVMKSFLSSSDNSEIQHQLIEKIWSAIQAQFVSTSLGLENIVAKYYRDVDVRFSKKDIIAAFNTARVS